ncbi:MAG TPA: DUF4214 domain-containing protein [Acidimicrobiales bacterium]|jgi:hypothetical protein|nr:DUF4214 domain-containing protein [Acidimicrobiales bacterium]HMS87519.1 DUF4214 domain-containing protein [Acidimicrobiales bacterium]HRA34067.1 DUF4214 domain-containing protein [Acidimicrobiales bacterium]
MPLRHRTVLTVAPALVLFTLLTAVVAVVAPQATSPAQAAGTPVMGRSVVSAADLAGWYRSTGKTSRATVGIDELATYYVDEGAAEGVAGDIAFAQSIVETGYFGFSARVPPELNNFSGLGAVDSGTTAEAFPDARTGVRAQIQHLRAYADPTVTEANLAHPLVDTRFALVKPKGRATTWDQFGGGVWATDPDYAGKVLGIRQQIMQWARRYGTARFAPFSGPGPFARQAFRDVLFREGTGGEINLWETALRVGTVTPEQFVAELFKGEGAGTVQPVTRLYFATLGRAPDRGGLAFWTNRRKVGAPLATLATQVMASREFSVRFGAPDDAAFVNLLYRNVLGRDADAAGRTYWVDVLAKRRMTRTGVLLWFSESPENVKRTAALVESTVLHLGLVLTLPTPEERADWSTARAGGARLDVLALDLLIDARYFARF